MHTFKALLKYENNIQFRFFRSFVLILLITISFICLNDQQLLFKELYKLLVGAYTFSD